MDPLLADFDIVGVIFTLAIIGFSILSKFLGEGGKVAPKRRPPRVQGANPPAQSIEAEIEEFLRQTRGAPRRAEPEEVEEEELEIIEPARLQQTRSAFDQTTDDEVITPGQGFGRELSQHVDQHIVQGSISTRDAHLGEDVENADERVEQRLEEVFEHQVGSLKHYDNTETTSQVAEGTDASAWGERIEVKNKVAEELVAMMKSPDSVRKLFIAKEIFERREF